MNSTNKKAPGVRGVPQPFNRRKGHAPQIKPAAARPQTGVSGHSRVRPSAPTALRPTATPTAVQPKMADGVFNREPPSAPPVYRPQQLPKVLQTKSALPQSPQAGQAPRKPSAPPVYRPQSKPAAPATQPVQAKARPVAVQCKLAAEAGRLSGPRVASRMRSHVTNVIQRSSDSDSWQMEVSSEEIDSDDQEILLSTSPHLGNWRRGVATGYSEGWYQGIEDERMGLPHQVRTTSGVAIGMVGAPTPGGILAAQVVPLGTWVVPGQEEDDGEEHGRQRGYQAGSDTASRVLGWGRANYPAIPHGNQVAALAQNGGQCVYCNAAASTQVDHVYPVQKHWITLGYQGANLAQVNDPSNLVGSCQPCNGSKTNHYLNNWNPPGWGPGQWFPHGPPVGTIPVRRGHAVLLGQW